MIRLKRFSFLCLALALLLGAGSDPSLGGPAGARLVAVGDVHGAFDEMVSILQRAGLIDAEHHWTGGNSVLVQTGDLVDRGPKSRAVMDLVMNLEKEASQQKGRVVALLGNHELMNLYGDLRYVVAQDYASFVDEKSEKRRQDAYRAHMEILRRRAALLRQPTPAFTPEMENQWMTAHPPGFVEHRAAFAPDGKYGRWIRSRAVIFQERGLIFLHGGVSPALAAVKVSQINSRVKNEIQTFDLTLRQLVEWRLALPFFTIEELLAVVQPAIDAVKSGSMALSSESDMRQRLQMLETFAGFQGWLAINPDGPLWFRGFSQWSDSEGTQQIAALVKAYGDVRFIVGHTVQTGGRMRSRFDGRVFLIDTGMLASFFPGGRPSALEITDGQFTAIYTDERTLLFDSSTAAR
jgi:Calcineurin-like phosphoesterase